MTDMKRKQLICYSPFTEWMTLDLKIMQWIPTKPKNVKYQRKFGRKESQKQWVWETWEKDSGTIETIVRVRWIIQCRFYYFFIKKCYNEMLGRLLNKSYLYLIVVSYFHMSFRYYTTKCSFSQLLLLTH